MQGLFQAAQQQRYVYKDQESLYFTDRSIQARSEEIINKVSQDVFAIRDEVFGGTSLTRLLSHQLTYYDGPAFIGLAYGELGGYGLPVRSESLVVTPAELVAAYGAGNIPPPFSEGASTDWSAYPTAFVNALHDRYLGYALGKISLQSKRSRRDYKPRSGSTNQLLDTEK